MVVTTRLDYCQYSLRGAIPEDDMEAATGTKSRSPSVQEAKHTTPTLQELNWLPDCFCAQLKMLLWTYTALYSQRPGYFKDHLLHRKISIFHL